MPLPCAAQAGEAVGKRLRVGGGSVRPPGDEFAMGGVHAVHPSRVKLWRFLAAITPRPTFRAWRHCWRRRLRPRSPRRIWLVVTRPCTGVTTLSAPDWPFEVAFSSASTSISLFQAMPSTKRDQIHLGAVDFTVISVASITNSTTLGVGGDVGAKAGDQVGQLRHGIQRAGQEFQAVASPSTATCLSTSVGGLRRFWRRPLLPSQMVSSPR